MDRAGGGVTDKGQVEDEGIAFVARAADFVWVAGNLDAENVDCYDPLQDLWFGDDEDRHCIKHLEEKV